MPRTIAFQAIPPAPGREGSAPAPAAAQAPPPAGSGPEAPPPGGLLGAFFPLLLVVPLLLFMFWSARSQQKKQAAAIAELKKGDRILTQSGLVGRLVEMGDRFAKVEIASGVKIEVLRSSVLGKDSAETQAQAEKK